MISVVIPSYNRKESMLHLLATIYAQEGVTFEVIVVDDHSADRTAEAIIERFPRTVVVRNEVNCGPAVCRNRGICLAKGEIIVGLDSDVMLNESDVLRKTEAAFRECPKANGLAFHIFRPEGMAEDVDRWWHPLPIEKFANQRFATIYFSGTAYALRRDAVLAAGLFPEILFMHYEEVELAYRILDNGGDILYCPELKAIHHEHVVSRRSEVRLFYKPRNQVLVAIGCYPVMRGICFLLPRLVHGFGLSVMHRHLNVFLRAMVMAVKMSPRRWVERKPLKPATWHRMAMIRRGSPNS